MAPNLWLMIFASLASAVGVFLAVRFRWFSLNGDEPEHAPAPRPTRGMGEGVAVRYALGFLGCKFVYAVGALAAVSAFSNPDGGVSLADGVITASGGIVFGLPCALIVLHMLAVSTAAYPQLTFVQSTKKLFLGSTSVVKSVASGAVALLVALPMIIVLTSAVQAIAMWLTQSTLSNSLAHMTLRALVNPDEPLALRVAMIVLVVACVPIIEELLYRGMLLKGLVKVASPWIATIVSAAIFAGMHYQPQLGEPAAIASAISSVFVLGVALAILRLRTGGVLAPIMLHMLFNALNVVGALLLVDKSPGI